MFITVIFNGNYLIKHNSPWQIKIPNALIKLVLKIALRWVNSLAKILVVVTFERHLTHLRKMKLA